MLRTIYSCQCSISIGLVDYLTKSRLHLTTNLPKLNLIFQMYQLQSSFLTKCIYFLVILLTIETLYFSSKYTFVRESCVTQKHSKDLYLLFIIIPSSPKNYKQRESVRNTWGSVINSYTSIKYMFFMGSIGVSTSQRSDVLEERDKYGDIVILDDVEESFNTLSSKVLKAFTWAGIHIDSTYYFKVDDDCYIVIENVYKAITDKHFPKKRVLFGNMMIGSPVLNEGKWAESNWILCPHVYLRYASGMGYILSKDVVRFIVVNRHRLQIYHNEDVAIGTWVAAFQMNYVDNHKVLIGPNHCDQDVWGIHGYNPKQVSDIHSSWLNGLIHCS